MTLPTVTPVRRYHTPRYPTQLAVLEDPKALRAVPQRWSAKPALCGMLMLTVAGGLCACSGGHIPVFEHGDGRGAFGCDSVVPPVFFSEEEAKQIIRDEAAEGGIDFTGGRLIRGTFPSTILYWDGNPSYGTWSGELMLDGYDAQLGIGFEFISKQDVIDWRTPYGIFSTVEFYDMIDTAQRLASAADHVAVFYDPTPDWSLEDTDIYEQKNLMRENLRLQVRDFLEWLKAEGII